MKPYGLAILIASILVVGCGGEMETGPDAEGEGAPASVVEEEAEEPAVSEGECAPLEREMAMHDATGSPLPFHLPYPEGWDVGEHAESRRVLDLVYQGEGRFADYVLRFMFLGGPSSDPSMTLEILRSDRRNEVTEETVDAGTLYLATTAHERRVTALVPHEEGTHYQVAGAITTAPDPCEQAALETIEEILRNLEPNRSMTPVGDDG